MKLVLKALPAAGAVAAVVLAVASSYVKAQPALRPAQDARAAPPAVIGPFATESRPTSRSRDSDTDPAEETPSATPPGEPAEPQLPQDGVLATEEPAPVLDGLDPNAVDSRQPEDIQAFAPAEAAAGYNPDLFSIELDPLLDRRPAQLFRGITDPYAPTGVRIGSFVVFPEAELAGAAFSNLFRSSADQRSDIAIELRPAVRAVSSWNAHALELAARGLTSFHSEFPSEDDRAYTLEARGRLDITRRTNIEAALSHDVSQETRGSVNSTAGASGRSDIVTDRAQLAFFHRFNRLSLQLRAALSERDYSPTTDTTGAVEANLDRDMRQHETAVRAAWELKPTFAVFTEFGTDRRDFAAASPSDRISRDSSGERYRAGVSFGNTSEKLRGEVSVGAARQGFDDDRLPEIKGVIVDANLAWRLSSLTSLLFTARSDVGDSTNAGSGGGITRSAGVELRHAFRRHLVGSVGTSYTRADYAGIDLVEEDLTTQVGLEYYASREVTLFGRYAHIDFASTEPNSSYTAEEFRVGMRLRR